MVNRINKKNCLKAVGLAFFFQVGAQASVPELSVTAIRVESVSNQWIAPSQLELMLKDALEQSQRLQVLPTEVLQNSSDPEKDYQINGVLEAKDRTFPGYVQFELAMVPVGPRGEDGERPYVAESKSVMQSEWQGWSSERKKVFFKELTFQLLNRLPYDGRILSVDGKYVSLSAGYENGLTLDQELEVVRAATVPSSIFLWQQVERQPRGKIKIVSLDPYSSVGEIVEQREKEAVQPGDGILNALAPSRVFFAKQVAKPETRSDQPVFQKSQSIQPLAVQKIPTPEPRAASEASNPAENPEESQPPESLAEVDQVKDIISEPTFKKGMFYWGLGVDNIEIRGREKYKSTTSPLLLNTVYLGYDHIFSPGKRIQYDTKIFLGQIKNKLAFGYRMDAIYSAYMRRFSGPKFLTEIGIGGALNGLSPNAITYGGFDMVTFGPVSRIFVKNLSTFRVEATGSYHLFGAGRQGYDSVLQSVKSYSGLFLGVQMEQISDHIFTMPLLFRIDLSTETIKSSDTFRIWRLGFGLVF